MKMVKSLDRTDDFRDVLKIKGIRECFQQIVPKLLKYGITDAEVCEMLNLTSDELQEIKNNTFSAS